MKPLYLKVIEMCVSVLFCLLRDFGGPFSEAGLSSQSIWGAQMSPEEMPESRLLYGLGV